MAKKKATTKKATTTAAKKTTKKAAAKTTKAAKKATEKDGDEGAVKVKKKRKSRKKAVEIIRRKVFWGVYNHAMKLVAKYEFHQRKAADKRASELSPEGKPPHFVQKVKDDIVEVAADPEAVEETAAPKKKTKK